MQPALRTRSAQRAGVGGDDLEVLGRIGVDDGEALLEIADEHGGRLLAGQRGADPLGVLGERHLPLDLGVDGVGELRPSR